MSIGAVGTLTAAVPPSSADDDEDRPKQATRGADEGPPVAGTVLYNYDAIQPHL